MPFILFHGTQESLDHIADRLKHHRTRRDPHVSTPHAPQALIVDDDVESIQPLLFVLNSYGFETTLAFDGQAALEELTKKTFDIVFLDICMPGMSGLEVLEKIEELQNTETRLAAREEPLAVVTYSSHPIADYDIPDGEAFYFADHWQKPITIGDLAERTGKTAEELGLFKNTKKRGTA